MVQSFEVWIPRSFETGDGCSTHLAIPSGLKIAVMAIHSSRNPLPTLPQHAVVLIRMLIVITVLLAVWHAEWSSSTRERYVAILHRSPHCLKLPQPFLNSRHYIVLIG